MKWFKHWNDLRERPAMKNIRREFGNEGLAVAYRLIEVVTEQYGSGKKFKPYLDVIGETNQQWLATELFERTDDDRVFPNKSTVAKLHEYLIAFNRAGLIDLEKIKDVLTQDTTTGDWSPDPDAWYWRLSIRGFAEMRDEWTMTKTDENGNELPKKKVHVLSAGKR